MPFTVQSAPVRRVNTLCLHGKRVPLFFRTHPLGFAVFSALPRKGIPTPSPCGEGRGGGYTLKYLSGVLANISPQMLSPGFIMQVSVRVRPVSSPTPSRRNTCRFSVWSGQAP